MSKVSRHPNRAKHNEGECVTESCWQPSIHRSEADTNTRVEQLRHSQGGKAINHQQADGALFYFIMYL